MGAGTLTLSANATVPKGTKGAELTAEENTGAIGKGNLTEGSTAVSGVLTTSGQFATGERISGLGIPAGTTIAAVGAGTLTLSNAVEAGKSATGAALTASDVPYNATAVELKSALEVLPGIGSGNLTVSGGPGDATGTTPYAITFSAGPLSHNDVHSLASTTANLDGAAVATLATPVPGGGPEVCKPSAGDVCKKGDVGTANGQFEEWWGPGLIAVGPGDIVYVGDKERIQKFNSDGTYNSGIALAGKGRVFALAVAPSGNIYVNYASGVTEVKPPIEELNSVGSLLCEIKAAAVAHPTALASDSAGDVYVFAAEGGGFSNEGKEIREFGPGCEEVGEPFAKGEFRASTGIAVNGFGNVYVGNAQSDPNSYIKAYGLPPVDYESPPVVPPEINAEFTVSVKAETAKVQAQINPKFWPDATYYVQYGTKECALPEASCKEQPVPPGAPLTTESISEAVTTGVVGLSGLAPGTTYHYRFVALSSGGGPVFGEDRELRTPPSVPPPPPDGRVYEKVSPQVKDGGEVGIPGPAGGGVEKVAFVQPQQATPAGGVVSYASATAFGEAVESAPAASQYLSRPIGPGSWSTENIDPRFEEGFLRDPIVGFSEDLSHAAAMVIEPALTSDALEGWPNLYWRDNASGVLTAVTGKGEITTPGNEPEITGPKKDYCLGYGGAPADSARVLFAASGALLAGDPSADSGFNLYEWSAGRPVGERLRLVSVLPNESAANPAHATSFGQDGSATGGAGCVDLNLRMMRHAISADGSRVFWTYVGIYEGAKNPLFARVGGTQTVELDGLQGGSGSGGEGQYWDASADGSKVFFTDPQKLTADSTATSFKPDLYRYDFDKEAGQRLSDLTVNLSEAADVQGVIGASEDGTYAYFVAKGKLTGEEESANHEKAQSGQSNLYAWHEGDGVRFIATLGTGDGADWTARPDLQTARVSPDGSHLAFLSSQSLTGFDNTVNTVTGAPGCQLGESAQLRLL